MSAKVTQEIREEIREELHRPDFGLRLIIVFKIVKAALLIAVAIGAFSLIHEDLHAAGARVASWFRIDPASRRLEHVLAHLVGVSPARVAEVGAGALTYSCVLLVEAWGLHRRRRWAEWFTIILTSSLIPVEIYELIEHTSIGKAIALLINVAVVLYLGRHRFLFTARRRTAALPRA